MKQLIQSVYDFNLVYARKLVADLTDEQWAAQPIANGNIMPNHAAWVFGHLASTSFSFALPLLNAKPIEKDGWGELFGINSEPCSDASLYLNKASLVGLLEESHALVTEAFAKVDEPRLALPNPAESLRPLFPTIGHMITFVMTSHEATHLGQLSALRRGLGLPGVFG